MQKIKIKRVYETKEKTDGYRILVDRLWPRGIKKENLALDLWAKAVAPTQATRKAFNHQPEKFSQFRLAYLEELSNNSQAEDFLQTVKGELEKQPVTLLFSAKDTEHNQAIVLKEWLEQQLNQSAFKKQPDT